jgi:hypothetical protein
MINKWKGLGGSGIIEPKHLLSEKVKRENIQM